MKKIILALLIATSTITISCDENSTPIPEVPQSIIDKSLSYFDGEIIEKELEKEDGIEKWEIKIQNDNGSIVKFYWRVNGQNLLKMEGQKGPFDYEIIPGNSLITYSTALTIAKGAVKNDKVTKWALKQDEDFIDKWVYSFEFDDSGDTIKVYIDAENGDILEID